MGTQQEVLPGDKVCPDCGGPTEIVVWRLRQGDINMIIDIYEQCKDDLCSWYEPYRDNGDNFEDD